MGMMNHPDVQEALTDPEVRSALEEMDVGEILQSSGVDIDPELLEGLSDDVDIGEILDMMTGQM